jgi:anti-sigma B factor antagonist
VGSDRGRRTNPDGLRLTSSSSGGVVRLAVAGEVDAANVDELTRAMSSIIRAQQPRRLVVDIADVTFLASTGIGALVAAHRLGRERRTELVVVNCRPAAVKVLEITGVYKVLTSGDPCLG